MNTWLKIDKIEKAIEEGWVNRRKHPDADLYILNYSSKTQIEFHWDKHTTMVCRGLIVDGDWNVIARPFQKFFTLDQLTSLRNSVHDLYGMKFKTMFDGPFQVYDKLDGSMGVLYPLGDKVYMATRGSFESEMAVEANKMLDDMEASDRKIWTYRTTGDDFDTCMFDKHTFMFEIIYPENRIVVDYGQERKLVLLDVLHKEDTSRDTLLRRVISHRFESATQYSHIKTLDDLEAQNDKGQEGYVLIFDSGLRVKWKFEEYKRLHHIVTGLNENVVWEWCKDGKNLKDTLDKVPDEFYNWAERVMKELKSRFKEIEKGAKARHKEVTEFNYSRKTMANLLRDYQYSGLVFAMLDGKPYQDSIWRIVKDELKQKKFKEKMKDEKRFDTPSICS